MGAEASFFKDLGELRTQRGVEKGDTPSNFAAEGMVEGIVVWAMGAVERLVAAFCRCSDSVAEAYCAACLEFPIVKVKSCLFGWSPPAKAVANAAAGEKPGLFGGGQLKPMFLGVNFINGIGEPALQGTNFTKEGGMEGEFVTRIGGGAD